MIAITKDIIAKSRKNKVHHNVNMIRRLCLFISLFSLFIMSGCKKTTEVVLSSDFDEKEVFRIEDETCTVPEIMVYMVNTENQYIDVFGKEVFDVPFRAGTVESQYKESILARLAQIKAMKLFAKERKISLSDSEDNLCRKAADKYYNSLSDEEKQYMAVTGEIIYKMYSEFALANKAYDDVVSTVNPEISDDEARSVTIKSLLIKTYTNDINGNKVDYNENEKRNAYKRAYEILLKIKDGIDFDVLSADYNEDDKSVYSFGRGVMPEAIETVAYNLSEGEVSDVIETEYGYHIIKCVSNFDQETTDLNKQTIVTKRKEEAFREAYDEFIKGLTSNLNKDLWDGISYDKRDSIKTQNFFDVYDEVFENQ